MSSTLPPDSANTNHHHLFNNNTTININTIHTTQQPQEQETQTSERTHLLPTNSYTNDNNTSNYSIINHSNPTNQHQNSSSLQSYRSTNPTNRTNTTATTTNTTATTINNRNRFNPFAFLNSFHSPLSQRTAATAILNHSNSNNNNNNNHHHTHRHRLTRNRMTTSQTIPSPAINNHDIENQTQQDTYSPENETLLSDIPPPLTTTTTNNNNNNDTNPQQEQLDRIQTLTSQLRCLFTCFTLPIPPLLILLFFFLLQLIYALFHSFSNTCTHPLKTFATLSIVLSVYTPNHKSVRRWLFNYSRERDGPIRPRNVQLFDQCFHFLCIWYIYFGILLMDTCEEDVVHVNDNFNILNEGGSNNNNNITDNADTNNNNNEGSDVSSCWNSCPELYQSTQRFVAVMQLLALLILLPIFSLPCIYLWIVRLVNSDEAWARMGQFVQESQQREDGILVRDVMSGISEVTLCFLDEGKKKVKVMGGNGGEWDRSSVKDCCICMCEMEVTGNQYSSNRHLMDLECGMDPSIAGGGVHSATRTTLKDSSRSYPSASSLDDKVDHDVIVQTKCGHLFHKSCIGGWIGDGWDDPTSDLRARRRCCPLCREDLSLVGVRQEEESLDS